MSAFIFQARVRKYRKSPFSQTATFSFVFHSGLTWLSGNTKPNPDGGKSGTELPT